MGNANQARVRVCVDNTGQHQLAPQVDCSHTRPGERLRTRIGSNKSYFVALDHYDTAIDQVKEMNAKYGSDRELAQTVCPQ